MTKDLIGQQFGNYQLTRLLGTGGFAEVYLGQHVRLNMQAAVKVLLTHLAEEDVQEFQREAQIIASLVHPNIVRLLDFDVKEGTPFLVMDYAPHGTLRQRYARGTPVPLPEVVASIKQVADALQYAHDQKLIHRDIKPENMLVGRRNEVVLSDFGIATVVHNTSSMLTQAPVGTIPYMAPEQIQAHPRPASDQYALAIVVHEWLCGERPFGGSYTEIFAKHLMTPPPPLREKLPSIPPDVEQVVLMALAKDPKERFVSVQAFATALEQASHSTPMRALPFAPTVPVPIAAQPLPPTVVAPPVAPTLPPTVVASSAMQSLPPTIVTPPLRQEAPLRGKSEINTPDQVHRVPLAPISPVPQPLEGTVLFTYEDHSNSVLAVAWSPDGRRIASTSDDKTVQVWDAADGGHPFTYWGHSKTVNAVAWSPDGRRIASASWDETVQVWDAADGGHPFTYKGHSHWLRDSHVEAVAWSPDGRHLASAGWDWRVQVWDAADGGHPFTYKGHSGVVGAMAWSPDGRRIASASMGRTVQVWDATDGGNRFTYKGHSKSVEAVAWSPDGRRIASASWDETVQVWDAADGGHPFTYRGHSEKVNAVAWSPDGRRIASASWDETVQVWQAP